MGAKTKVLHLSFCSVQILYYDFIMACVFLVISPILQNALHLVCLNSANSSSICTSALQHNLTIWLVSSLCFQHHLPQRNDSILHKYSSHDCDTIKWFYGSNHSSHCFFNQSFCVVATCFNQMSCFSFLFLTCFFEICCFILIYLRLSSSPCLSSSHCLSSLPYVIS